LNDTRWAEHFQLPPVMNMMEAHDRREQVFIRQGTSMCAALVDCIARHERDVPIPELDILDFGCGVGRVALPLFYAYRKPTACVDVDPACIDYLNSQIPEANPTVCGYNPPLPFDDGSFDVIYAVSVWTHLPPEKAHEWMLEMVRVLRPGGVALITTSNYPVLAVRREKLKAWGWENVTDDDLRREGMIFLKRPRPLPELPGPTEWRRTTRNGFGRTGPSTCRLSRSFPGAYWECRTST